MGSYFPFLTHPGYQARYLSTKGKEPYKSTQTLVISIKLVQNKISLHLVDLCVGHKILSFMDEFLGYNHIGLHQLDQYKASFTTPWGTFTYRVLPFTLKNDRTAFQRVMPYVFNDLSCIILSFFNDLIEKYNKRIDNLTDLQTNFFRCHK